MFIKKKEVLIYNPNINNKVTWYYIKVIEESFLELGYKTDYIDRINKEPDNSKKIVVVITSRDAIVAKKAGFKKIVYWVQGVTPEEVFFIKRDFLRYLFLSYRDYIALKCAVAILFCSEKMKSHYEKKYRLSFDNRFYIMPCFNEEIHEQEIVEKSYDNNDFVYAGSLIKWQNFEEIVKYYKRIEERVSNARLKAYVTDKKTAKKILEENHVQNYVLDYVSQNELTNEILQAKFGFCIRKKIIINQVATPTKLSTYISNGIFPIYSECLSSFHANAKNSQYCFNVDDENTMDRIVELCNRETSGKAVKEDYNRCFGTYYSSGYHKERIKKLFLNIQGLNE